MKITIYLTLFVALSFIYVGCKQPGISNDGVKTEQAPTSDEQKPEEDTPIEEEVKDIREEAVSFGQKVIKTMFEKDCDEYKSHLSDPFLFLSEGFVEMEMYANEFCNEFDLFNRGGVTFDEYLENNMIDVYKADELDSVYDENNKILNFREYLDEAIEEQKLDFSFGENDFLIIGFRPKEGKTPLNVNKDRLHFFAKKLENGSFKVSGVFN